MPLTCPHCLKVLDIAGETPRFCAYCGQSLSFDGGSAGRESSTVPSNSETTTAHHTLGPDDSLDMTGTWTQKKRRVPAPLVPDRIAGYRIIAKLGQGGMGSVHEAEDTQTGRRVAIKLMAPEFLTSSRAIERFIQEGRLAGTIAHPRCVFVLAAEEADGWPFIVMELMPGTTLKDVIERNGPMSPRRAISTILDAIEGLEEAHRRGVIHRDVKPSNCFIDGDGRIKVGDFGLSKSVVDDSGLTRTGTFIGTPHFASPEQIKGEDIDERSDVYSVCATLYYLITGHAPFEGPDAASTLAKIVSDPTPSARSRRPDLWIPLDRVISKGLERDRKRRWANLEELRAALSPFLPGRVTLSSVGLRIAAYLTDSLIVFLLLALIAVVFDPFEFRAPRQSISRMRFEIMSIREEIESGLLLLIYWFVFEVFGEASPGKRLFRLRIGSSEAGPATWKSRVIRLSVFAMLVILPRRIAFLTLRSYGGWIPPALQVIGPLILFVGARPSNGNRGLHDFASGAAVVRLPWRFQRRKKSFEVDGVQPFHLSRHEGMPESLGSYKIEGSLRWSDQCRLLQACDESLRRDAWIVMRPESQPQTARSRTDLARLTRMRWLSSGTHEGWRWDAYVAPVGAPLAMAARGRHKRRGWSETREILDELAVELVDASCDGTLPDDLSLDQVWIRPNGRVLLVDVTPHSTDDPDFDHLGKDKDPQKRGLELLSRVCSFMLHGSTSPRGRHRSIGIPIPRHAVPILEGLWNPDSAYRSVEAFREAIHSIRGLPSELTPLQQLGHAVYTLISFTAKIWMVPAIVVTWNVITSFVERTNAPVFSEELWERCLFFATLLWTVVGMTMRGGLSSIVFNVSLTTTQGQRPGRFLFGWREFLIVGPVLLVNVGLDFLPLSENWVGMVGRYGGALFGLAWPIINLIPVFFKPGRYLVDLLAGTVYVPR